ncbi:hypothetical protein F2Q69_00059465 [Brassica cretica]|uniref:Uncharacterized protein n=1 Tax=Brassica cretica TaxID=69181 RepID=A0A8S9RPG8_BRACR|nr:hypothetical protein F2Q69_00059465 [Brassica cretica]
MKTTQQSIDYNSLFLVDRSLDPKTDFSDPNPFSTFSSTPTSKLILNWSTLYKISLHLDSTFSRGSWAIYRKQQPIRNKPCGSPCVASHGSRRMCGGTSCSTWLAACLSLMQDDTTPSTCLDEWPGCMQGDTTSSTCLAAWPGRMHRNTSCLADPPRAPLLYLHVQVSCTAAPHASLTKHTARSLPPRPEHTHIKTPRVSRSIRPISSFPVNFRSAINPKYFSMPVLVL